MGEGRRWGWVPFEPLSSPTCQSFRKRLAATVLIGKKGLSGEGRQKKRNDRYRHKGADSGLG